MTFRLPFRWTLLTSAFLAVMTAGLVAQAPVETRPEPAEAAVARQPATAAERAERQTRLLTERLSLRDDQVEPVRKLSLEGAQRREAIRKATRETRDRRGGLRQLQALQEEQTTAFRAILDDEQFAEFEVVQQELTEQRKAQRQSRRGRRPPRG